MQSQFHFAFHVTDLEASRKFYGGMLGCAEGRSTAGAPQPQEAPIIVDATAGGPRPNRRKPKRSSRTD